MSATWFTADWHFGHQNICRLAGRPFASIDEMNAELISRHNALVAPEDIVWVLGDVAMGKLGESLPLCARMNGRKILVCGNHDRPAMVPDTKVEQWTIRYREEGGFEQVITGYSHLYVVVDGQRCAVSHYPYTGESFEGRQDRYAERRPLDAGTWLLHGHVHDQWRVNGRQINVGVDVWDFAPVHAETISGIIKRCRTGSHA